MKRVRLLALALVALSLVALGWWWTSTHADTAQTAAEHSLVIEPQPFVATLVFAGKIVPGEAISITAPFDGDVRAIGFTYGDHVAAGDTLLVLDRQEIEAARNQAEAGYLKARQPAEAVANWAHGPEVAAARRRAQLAAIDLAKLDREARESRRLLDKGLIPRNEHDGVEQQLLAQRMTVAAANDELGETLARGGPAAARIARLELGNARAGLSRLDTAMDKAAVRAPASGMLLPPPAGGRPTNEPLHPGTRISRGQLIGTVARDGGLSVNFEVDEADVNALAIGQPVIATGAGFAGIALNGKLSAISVPVESANGPTRFTATARLDGLTPDQIPRVRIGMSAAVAVITYQAPTAMIVPPEAVIGSAPEARVIIRRGADTVERRVVIGRVAPAGVEIRQGLRRGDVVVWSEPATPPPPPGAK